MLVEAKRLNTDRLHPAAVVAGSSLATDERRTYSHETNDEKRIGLIF